MTIVFISIKILVILVTDLSNSTFTNSHAFVFTGNTTYPPINVNDMPDGLSIQGTEQLRAVTATWDVFVTLDAPPYPSMLARQVDALDQTLTELEALKTVDIDLDLSPHRLRRDSLRAMLDMHPRPTRSKRSLLGAGGSLLHLILASANVSATPEYQNDYAFVNVNATANATISHVFPLNGTWPNTTWTSNSSLILKPSYWQWEPSTGSYSSLLDAGSSLLHALFGLNNSLAQATHAPTEAPTIHRAAPSRSASTLLNLIFGTNSSSDHVASNSVSDGSRGKLLHPENAFDHQVDTHDRTSGGSFLDWADNLMLFMFSPTSHKAAHVPSQAGNVTLANATHNVRLAHDVMPNHSIMDIGTSLVEQLFPLQVNVTDRTTQSRAHDQPRTSRSDSYSFLNMGSSLMGGLFGMRNSSKLREKRGLLDVGGSILHHLFGVATSSQLNRYRLAMKEVAGQQVDTMHAYDSLASVVNQTRAYTRQLALRQRQLVQHAQELTTAIELLTKTSQSQQQQLQKVQLLTDLDRFLDVLD